MAFIKNEWEKKCFDIINIPRKECSNSKLHLHSAHVLIILKFEYKHPLAFQNVSAG